MEFICVGAAVDILDEYENNLEVMELIPPLPIQQKPILRKFTVEEVGLFQMFSLEGRVDSFNFDDVKKCLLDLASHYPHGLAVNLEKAEFLCIPFIKLLAQIATALKAQDHRLALVSPSEKLKRQIDIFATLDDMVVFRSKDHLLR